MRVLVTAGGTAESIDGVRKITNTSTGRLGALIADEFIKNYKASVTFVCGETSALPSSQPEEIIKISSVADLKNTLEVLFGKNKYDAVIHAMAVSDYSVRGITPLGELAVVLARTIISEDPQGEDELADFIKKEALALCNGTDIGSKISSNIDNPVLLMEKTPKIIGQIKSMQPNVVLVGFKLLSGVSLEELLAAGNKLMAANYCDFVLANDSAGITSDKHEGYLIDVNGGYITLHTKKAIAECIAVAVAARVRERGNL